MQFHGSQILKCIHLGDSEINYTSILLEVLVLFKCYSESLQPSELIASLHDVEKTHLVRKSPGAWAYTVSKLVYYCLVLSFSLYQITR